MKTIGSILAIATAILFPAPPAGASIYYVSPTGNNNSDGLSSVAPWASIQYALSYAVPGDTIKLLDGTYWEDVKTVRSGRLDAPIIVQGGSGAVLKGAGATRIVQINHDFITLQGFTIDGLAGAGDQASDYRGKLIYVISTIPKQGVQGVRILSLTLMNAGDEGVRLRYFAHHNEIANNTILNCGVHDFVFNGGGKNGEGIYLGTAPEEWGLNGAPTADADQTRDNWVHHNTINTQGGEAVDVKEASTANLIEYNICTGVKDTASGALNSRGNGNVFRYNQVFANLGAGVRLGGDTADWGINNDVYENLIHDNSAGGIKFMASPQGDICGNTMYNNTGGDSVGTYNSLFNPTADCPVADTQAPSVAIVSPGNGSYVTRSSTVTITVNASDNVAVAKVEIYINGGLKTVATSAPYRYAWKVPPKAKVVYTLTAVAYDFSANKATATVRVTSK